MPDYISVTLTHKETIVKNTPCVKNNLRDLITQLKNVQKNVNEHLTDLVNSSGAENSNGDDGCCEDDEDDENEEDIIEKAPHHKRRKLERETSSTKKLKSV